MSAGEKRVQDSTNGADDESGGGEVDYKNKPEMTNMKDGDGDDKYLPIYVGGGIYVMILFLGFIIGFILVRYPTFIMSYSYHDFEYDLV